MGDTTIGRIDSVASQEDGFVVEVETTVAHLELTESDALGDTALATLDLQVVEMWCCGSPKVGFNAIDAQLHSRCVGSCFEVNSANNAIPHNISVGAGGDGCFGLAGEALGCCQGEFHACLCVGNKWGEFVDCHLCGCARSHHRTSNNKDNTFE